MDAVEIVLRSDSEDMLERLLRDFQVLSSMHTSIMPR